MIPFPAKLKSLNPSFAAKAPPISTGPKRGGIGYSAPPSLHQHSAMKPSPIASVATMVVARVLDYGMVGNSAFSLNSYV